MEILRIIIFSSSPTTCSSFPRRCNRKCSYKCGHRTCCQFPMSLLPHRLLRPPPPLQMFLQMGLYWTCFNFTAYLHHPPKPHNSTTSSSQCHKCKHCRKWHRFPCYDDSVSPCDDLDKCGDWQYGPEWGNCNRPQGEQRATASSVIMYTPEGGSRKRNRTDNEVGGSPSRPRFDEPDMLGNPTPCWICGKQFSLWKALFEHMRSHPERQWRGLFPPPTFRIDGSPENASEGQPPRHQQQPEIVRGKSGGNVKNTDNPVAIQGESSKKSENDLASILLKLVSGQD